MRHYIFQLYFFFSVQENEEKHGGTTARYLLKHGHVEGVLQVSKVFSYHLLGQPFSADQKSRYTLRAVLQESSSDQVADASFRLFVEQIQAYSVLAFPHCL